MTFDIIYLLLLALAAWNGFRKGLVLALFSLLAVVIGLAAAMKLSVVTADWVGTHVSISRQWLPVISFLLVFLIVLILVRLGARAIEQVLRLAMLGWVNRVAGALLYCVMLTIVLSILVFYAIQMRLLGPSGLSNSLTYGFVQPWGPRVMSVFGELLPWFRDMFEELKAFFEGVRRGA